MSYRDVTIRRAGLADEAELTALAALDDAPPLAGETLLAEVDGGVWAALSLGDGRVVSDPFRPAAEARALLALRAAHLGRPSEPESGTGRGAACSRRARSSDSAAMSFGRRRRQRCDESCRATPDPKGRRR